MKAVVLVGGFGTRLRPLTDTTPKNLLPVGGVPMMERVVTHLAEHGVTEVVLALGYKPDQFLAAYPDGTCAGVPMRYAVEDEPLDTAGAIRYAATSVGFAERFVVVNGDVLTDLDLTRLIRFHEASGAEGTVALHTVEDPSRYGVVVTDVAGRVEAFVEKPPADEAPSLAINAGTYVFEPSVLTRIDADGPVSVERETFPAMVADGTLYALDGDAYWLDAGTPETYVQANVDALAVTGDRADGSGGAYLIDETASVAASATVERSVVGAGVVVGEHAVVREAVLLDGASVGDEATVERSVVGSASSVGAGASLTECTMTGAGSSVAAGGTLVGERVPAEAAG